MKSSALALMTAAALLFGANAASFAQEASTTGTTSSEECSPLDQAGTPVGESLVNDQESDDNQTTATGTKTGNNDAVGGADDEDDAVINCDDAMGGDAMAPAATGDAMAPDAMSATTPEDCLILQGAGATPPDESLVNDQASDDDQTTSTGTKTGSSDATSAVDDVTPEDCEDIDTAQ